MESFTEHQIYFDEYITGNRFIDICEELQITFCKTDYLSNYANTEQPIFVTHNSDYHIEKHRYSNQPKNIKNWFALNKDYIDNRIVAIPIGLESMSLRINPTSHMGKYSSIGNGKDSLQKAIYIDKLAKQKIKHNKLVYLNINPNTFPTERQHVINLFSNTNEVTTISSVSWKQYYQDIASHKFVFSPRGNGVDCHRTWEALYLRTVPIVRKSTHMDEFSDLPIFFVENWEDVCYNKLNNFYEQVKSSLYDLDKMKISYWKNKIKECMNE